MRSAIETFVSVNKVVSRGIEEYLLPKLPDLEADYEERVAEIVNSLSEDGVVVDAGAGTESRFARLRTRDSSAKIVGIDMSAEALAKNEDVDEKIVCNIAKNLPFEAGTVDVLASHLVLEHLADTEAFVSESRRVLKPGGYWIHVFASKFALFALANQAFPSGLTRRLLRMTHPECAERIGFETYYDRTHPAAIRSVLLRQGFELEEIRVAYRQANYANFFVPLYLVLALYERILQIAGLETLGAKVMVVAKRR